MDRKNPRSCAFVRVPCALLRVNVRSGVSQKEIRIESALERTCDIGFVDAAVLAIAERLNEPKLATLDHRHFAMLRPRHVEALSLLP